MADFPQAVPDYWDRVFANGDVIQDDDALSITLNPALNRERRVMLLETASGHMRAALTPALATKAGLDQEHGILVSGLRQRLAHAGVALHEADCIFYFPEPMKQRSADGLKHTARQLTEGDRDVFAVFQAEASEQDLEDAYVELDHWAVFGVFDHGRLVSAASMYPWDNAPIADLGVLTLPDFRGRGFGQAVVRSISEFARDRGYEPQYRCQLDNRASISLAKASGLMLFGKWEVIASDPPDHDAA